MVRIARVLVHLPLSSSKTHVTGATLSTRTASPATRLNKRRLLRLKRRTEAVKATERDCLVTSESQKFKWLLVAQKRIRQGLLTPAQVKRLEPYCGLNEIDQDRKLRYEPDEAELRRYLKIFNGHTVGKGSHNKAQQSVPTVSYHQPGSVWETQHTRLGSLYQQADCLSPQQPRPGKTPQSSPIERPRNQVRRRDISLFQRSGGIKAFWRVRSLGKTIKQRIVSAQARLIRFLGRVSPFQWDISHNRTEQARLISNFFTRRDSLFFHMSQDPLRFHWPPPTKHLDLFDAATRVVRVENVIGYSFHNKLLCVEALKTNKDSIPVLAR